MVDITPDRSNQLASEMVALKHNVTTFGKDMSALDKTLGELKGSVDGLKHSQQMLTAAAGIVAALFLAALAYLGAQIQGLEGRVDGVISGVADVRGELKAINQRLMVLEDIRDRLKGLASIEPKAVPIERAQPVAAGDGVMLVGNFDPAALQEALKHLSQKYGSVPVEVRMVGISAPAEGSTKIIYTPSDITSIDAEEAWKLQFDRAINVMHFEAAVGMLFEEHPAGGTLVVSTDDPAIENVVGKYGASLHR